jgi:hypothetical protein
MLSLLVCYFSMLVCYYNVYIMDSIIFVTTFGFQIYIKVSIEFV